MHKSLNVISMNQTELVGHHSAALIHNSPVASLCPIILLQVVQSNIYIIDTTLILDIGT